MTQLAPLTPILRRVRRRLRSQRALDLLARTVPISFTLLAAAVVAERLEHGWLAWALPTALVLPVVVVLIGALRRIPLARAAHALDCSHQLCDRIQSALLFASEATPSPFMLAAIRDAERRAPELSVSRAAPLHVPRAVRYSLPAAAALALAKLLPLPAPRAPAAPAQALGIVERSPLLDADTSAAFEDELEHLRTQANLSPEVARWVRDYERILEQMAQGELSREQALSQLDALKRSLDAARAAHEAASSDGVQRIADSLANAEASRAVASALSAGQLVEAADALHALARRVRDAKLSARERARLREALKEAAEAQPSKKPSEPDLLQKKRRPHDAPPKEPSLLKKDSDRERELSRLRREQRAKERARRALDRLRRELGRASQSPSGESGRHLEQGAQRMRDLAQQGMDAEQQRKLAQQLEQLRQQLQRQRQAQAQSGDGRGSRQSGTGQGQSERLKRFSLQAGGGQQGETEGTPLVMGQPQKPSPAQGKGEPAKETKGAEDEAGKEEGRGKKPRTVLQLGGDGQPNAQLELPGMTVEEQSMGQESGDDPASASAADPRHRLSGELSDSQLSGLAGKGPSRSEVIYGAAEQGFANAPYTKVYTDYRSHAESVLERDEVPPGYRYYVRRYFQLIRPREGDGTQ